MKIQDMKFQTTSNGRPIIFLAGFHDSRMLDGEIFINRDQAERYVSDKVIHIKEVAFYSERLFSVIEQICRSRVNHAKNLGINFDLSQVEDEQIREYIKTEILG